MLPSSVSYRGSRGACFAQILMKNLPASLSGLTKSCEPLSTSPSPGKDVFDQHMKTTFKSGEFQNVIDLNITGLYQQYI